MSKRTKTELQFAERAMTISQEMQPYLAELDPGLQGTIILDLLSLWLAGWPQKDRKEMLDQLVAALPDMIEARETEMFGHDGHPHNESAHSHDRQTTTRSRLRGRGPGS